MELCNTQTLQQQQKLSLTQEMRQSLKILSMPACELSELILQAVDENVLLRIRPMGENGAAGLLPASPLPNRPASGALEESSRSNTIVVYAERRGASAGWSGDCFQEKAARSECTFEDMLLEQLRFLPLEPGLSALCRRLVGCLNRRGYLEAPLPEIARDLRVPHHRALQALRVVQSLEPAGVGARDLKECLLLQLKSRGLLSPDTARLVKEGLPALAEQDMRAVAELLGCGKAAAERAAKLIRSLDPIPSSGFDTGCDPEYVIPEASVRYENGEYVITMNDRDLPALALHQEYGRLLRFSADETAVSYYRTRLPQAKALIRNLENRNVTLQRVLRCVVDMQPAFFRYGTDLAPMKLSDVARCLKLNVSTVCRAVRHKYVVCVKGTVSLKSLFGHGLPDPGGNCASAGTVKALIAQVIRLEDRQAPLSDDRIRERLAAMCVHLSRRTVAKYRKELGVPDSYERRARA